MLHGVIRVTEAGGGSEVKPEKQAPPFVKPAGQLFPHLGPLPQAPGTYRCLAKWGGGSCQPPRLGFGALMGDVYPSLNLGVFL